MMFVWDQLHHVIIVPLALTLLGDDEKYEQFEIFLLGITRISLAFDRHCLSSNQGPLLQTEIS